MTAKLPTITAETEEDATTDPLIEYAPETVADKLLDVVTAPVAAKDPVADADRPLAADIDPLTAYAPTIVPDVADAALIDPDTCMSIVGLTVSTVFSAMEPVSAKSHKASAVKLLPADTDPLIAYAPTTVPDTVDAALTDPEICISTVEFVVNADTAVTLPVTAKPPAILAEVALLAAIDPDIA